MNRYHNRDHQGIERKKPINIFHYAVIMLLDFNLKKRTFGTVIRGYYTGAYGGTEYERRQFFLTHVYYTCWYYTQGYKLFRLRETPTAQRPCKTLRFLCDEVVRIPIRPYTAEVGADLR